MLISHFSFDVEDTHGVAFHWRVVEDEIEAVIEGKDTQSWVAVGEAIHFGYLGEMLTHSNFETFGFVFFKDNTFPMLKRLYC